MNGRARTEVEVAELRRMAANPTMTIGDIAASLGCCERNAHRLIAKHCPEDRIDRTGFNGGSYGKQYELSPWHDPTLYPRVVALADAKTPTRRIAEILGLTKNQVIGKLFREGYNFPPRKAAQCIPAMAADHPLAAVRQNDCRWPTDMSIKRPAMGFCCKPIAGIGLPYCAAHMARAYMKVPT